MEFFHAKKKPKRSVVHGTGGFGKHATLRNLRLDMTLLEFLKWNNYKGHGYVTVGWLDGSVKRLLAATKMGVSEIEDLRIFPRSRKG